MLFAGLKVLVMFFVQIVYSIKMFRHDDPQTVL
jgi:hypothetical protein